MVRDWSTWLKTRGWGSRVCSAGRRAVCGGVQLLPCWWPWRRWKVAAAFSQTLWQNGERKDKRQGMQVSAKDCFQAGKRKHFQDQGCQILEQVAEKSCGYSPKQPIIKDSLLSAEYLGSWLQGQWKLSGDSDSGFLQRNIQLNRWKDLKTTRY